MLNNNKGVLDTLQISPTVLETIRWSVYMYVFIITIKVNAYPCRPENSSYQINSFDCILVQNGTF